MVGDAFLNKDKFGDNTFVLYLRENTKIVKNHTI